MELPKKHLLNVAGVVINPATEDGNLDDIRAQTDKLKFTGDDLKVTGTATVSGAVSVSNFPATQTVDGSVSVGNFPASQAVTGTFWQTTQPVSGSVAVSSLPSTAVATATVIPVTVSTTVATLLTSNAARTLAVIWNETGTLFVKAGSGATSSSYTWRLTANTELDITDYTGIVTAVKATGTSTCLVTDF
jgi:hypothetical protein